MANCWPLGGICHKNQLWYVLLWYKILMYLMIKSTTSKEKLIILQRKYQYIMKLWPLSFRLDSAFQGWWMAILVLESQVWEYQMFQKIEPQKSNLFLLNMLNFLNLSDYPVHSFLVQLMLNPRVWNSITGITIMVTRCRVT